MLVDRGATVLGYVHENGLVISISDPERLRDAGLTWMGALGADDKISPLLTGMLLPESRAWCCWRSFPTRTWPAVRQAVLDAGAALVDNPDLTPLHLLLTATPHRSRPSRTSTISRISSQPGTT